MALTLRLNPELHNRAMAHAHRTGLSLNKLVAVALDDYLTPREDSAGLSIAPADLAQLQRFGVIWLKNEKPALSKSI